MQPESRKLLSDAKNSVEAIERFVDGKQLADLTNRLLRSAIYYEFVIIGEALSQLRALDEGTFDRITESHQIVGFRNQIIHGYPIIRDKVTWDIIHGKLPILKEELAILLAE